MGSLAPKESVLVFVSHAGEDTWVARQIAREISCRGAQTFLDEAEIDVGAEFEEDIRQFLEQADELLVLCTPWALERPYIWIEIGIAWFRKIPIIVVLHGMTIRELLAQPNAPVFLKERNIIHLNKIDQYLEQLESRLSKEEK